MNACSSMGKPLDRPWQPDPGRIQQQRVSLKPYNPSVAPIYFSWKLLTHIRVQARSGPRNPDVLLQFGLPYKNNGCFPRAGPEALKPIYTWSRRVGSKVVSCLRLRTATPNKEHRITHLDPEKTGHLVSRSSRRWAIRGARRGVLQA